MKKENILAIVPLFPAQQQMLVASLRDGQETYVQQLLFRVDASVTVDAIERAFQALVNGYEHLRAVVLYEGLKQPVWAALKDMRPQFLVKQIADAALPELMRADRQKGFDFQREPILRFQLLVSEDAMHLLVTNHHILCDGWGRQQILADFMQALREPARQLPLRNMRTWHDAWKRLDHTRAISAYTSYLAEFEEFAKISSVDRRDDNKRDVVRNSLPVQPLQAAAQQLGLTVAEYFAFLWACFIARWTEQPHVQFGFVKQNGLIAHVTNGFGLGIQTLPIQFVVRLEASFQALAPEFAMRERSVADAAFVDVTQPIFQGKTVEFMMAFENYPVTAGLQAASQSFDLVDSYDYSEFPLSLAITPTAAAYELDWHFALRHHSAAQVRAVADGFGDFARFAIQNLGSSPSEFPVYGNSVAQEFSASIKSADFFEQFECGLLSQKFAEPQYLLQVYLRLCDWIGKHRMPKIWIVGDKHALTPLCIVAAWKMGSMVVTINEKESPEFVQRLYDAERPQQVLGNAEAFPFVKALAWEKLLEILPETGGSVASIVENEGPALGICTSGSTGEPKLVLLSLANMLAFFAAWKTKLPWADKEVFAAIAHPAFDIGIAELIFPIWNAWELQLITATDLADLSVLDVKLERVTAFHMVPSILEFWIDHANASSRNIRVMTGGDKVPPRLQRKLHAKFPNARLFQFYGPSECSVLSSGFENSGQFSEHALPIGTVFQHAGMEIVTPSLRRAAPFQEGEIIVFGPAVGLGYGGEHADNQKFFTWNGHRAYRTGDLGYMNAHEEFFFLGRSDNQIKINGQRLEVPRIEAALAAWSGIPNWIVIYANNVLGALYLNTGHPSLPSRELLYNRLPAFAVPHVFVPLATIPLNKNGKVDRKELERQLLKTAQYAQEAEMDVQWAARLLGLFPDRQWNFHIGWYANGLNSIDAMRLSSKLRSETARDYSIQSILSVASLLQLAEIEGEAEVKMQAIAIGSEAHESAARLLFLSDADAYMSQSFWIPTGIQVQGFVAEETIAAWLRRQKILGIAAEFSEGRYVWKSADVEFKTLVEITEDDFTVHVLEHFPTIQVGLFCCFVGYTSGTTLIAWKVHHALLDGLGIEELWQYFGEYLKSGRMEEIPLLVPPAQAFDQAFWTNYLEGIEVSKLPFERKRQPAEAGKVLKIPMQANALTGLRSLCNALECSMFEAGLIRWAQYWHRRFPQGDFSTGIPVSARDATSEAGIQAMSLNMLPFRIVSADPKDILAAWRALFQRRKTPFSSIAQLDKGKNKDGLPFFNTCFLYHHFAATNASVKSIDFPRTHAAYPLSLDLIENDGQFFCSWEFRSDLFSETAIRALQAGIFGEPATAHELPAFDCEDLNLRWNRILRDHGDRIAIDCQGVSLSYDALGMRVEALKLLWVAKQPRHLLLVLDRSVNSVALILSAMFARIPFVPFDAETPIDRIRQIELQLQETAVSHATIDTWQPNPLAPSLGEDVLYAIATSGSTGTPKIVGVRRTSYAAAIAAWEKDYAMQPTDICLQAASFSFDVSLGDIGRALFQGARLVLADAFTRKDPDALRQMLVRHKVTVFETTPLIVRWWMSQGMAWSGLQALRLLIVGSDAWRMQELQQLAAGKPDGLTIISSYGLSETTIDNTFFVFGPEAEYYAPQALVPIGRPMAHSQISVVDADGHKVSDGMEGFLGFSGPCVGKGYWVEDAWTLNDNHWVSADRGMRDEYGNCHFLGRADRQVKIRGNRLEINEVESVLARLLPHIQWVVVDYEQGIATAIAACFVGEIDAGTLNVLRRKILASYPSYFLPSQFLQLPSFPMNQNGKIDLSVLRLSLQNAPPMSMEFASSGNVLNDLLDLFEYLFDERPLPEDNFFALGFNSIHVIGLMRAWNEQHESRMSAYLVFTSADFRELATRLEAERYLEYAAAAPESGRKISKAQEAIWFEIQQGDPTLFNLPHWVEIPAQYDLDRVQQAIEATLREQPSLFVRFESDEAGNVFEMDLDPSTFRLQVAQLEEDALTVRMKDGFFHEIDLATGPAFEANIFQTETRNFLYFNPHHLVYDGGSDAPLREAFVAHYEGRPLPVAPRNIATPMVEVDWDRYFALAPQPQLRSGKVSGELQTAINQVLDAGQVAQMEQVQKQLACSSAVVMGAVLGYALQQNGYEIPWLSLVVDTRDFPEVGLWMRAFPFPSGLGQLDAVHIAQQKWALGTLFQAKHAQVIYPLGTQAEDFHQVGLVMQHPFSLEEPHAIPERVLSRPRLPLTLYVEQFDASVVWRWEFDRNTFSESDIAGLQVSALESLSRLVQIKDAPMVYSPERIDHQEVAKSVEPSAELKSVWSQYVAASQPSETHFFRAGGNSLQALMLLNAVKRNMGIAVSSAQFFREPTLDFLARQQMGWDAHDQLVWEMQLGARGDIWLFPPILGLGMIFNSLELPQGQSVTALSYPDAVGISGMNSIEEIAGLLVASALKGRNIPERMSIVGYSMGGIVAFEVCKRMEAMGVQVERLTILDKPAQPEPGSEWTQSDLGAELEAIVAKMAIDVADAERLHGYLARHQQLIERYQQRGIVQAEVRIYYCADGFDPLQMQAWQEFSKRPVILHKIDGVGHYEIPAHWNDWGLLD